MTAAGHVLRGLLGLARTVVVGAACLVLANLVLLGVVLLPVLGAGIPVLVRTFALVRLLAGAERRWAGRELDVAIPESPDLDPADGARGPDRPPVWQQLRRLVRRGTTWRHLVWLQWEVTVGLWAPVLLLISVRAAVVAVERATSPLSVVLRVALAAALVLAPILLTWPLRSLQARVSRWLLADRSHRSRLARRVDELTQARTVVVEAQETLMRRIERDLHDGIQAHVVSAGMTLGLGRSLLQHDPAQAEELLVETENILAQTLQELRVLVRGIRPPVLAERGLAAAVLALAARSTLPVERDVELPGPFDPVVETAMYFAIAEALANVARHSDAGSAGLHLAHRRGSLVAAVTDDGKGGADLEAGTGLRGVRDRLVAVDGVLTVSSPPGGPTEIRMELPCEPLSPKTSPSSGTGSSGS